MTSEQSELIEKLNCLEFETSQLNHAYQLWRSNVEQGTVPEWMAAAIRVTYEALMMVCLDTVSAIAMDSSHVNDVEGDVPSDETAPPRKRAMPAEDTVTALRVPLGQPFQYEHAETDPPVHFTALIDGSLALTPLRQQNRIVGMLALTDAPRAALASQSAELAAAACEISGILGEESTTAEPSLELLPIMEPDWCGPEIPAVVSSTLTGEPISLLPAIQQGQLEERAAAERAGIRILATFRLPNWLQGSRTRIFGAASAAILATVAILVVVGGATGIYLARPHHARAVLPVENSTAQEAAGAVAIPTREKAEFKFDRDPVVAPLGSAFVLNAVLSRGTDIASVAAQIDYDANLLQLMGVSEGGFLVKAGQNFVVAQRDDPSTGVLKVNAEQPPGTPGISGDGPVFALTFHARKKGKGAISIIPGAHDSQGRRIEMTGSQISVRVN